MGGVGDGRHFGSPYLPRVSFMKLSHSSSSDRFPAIRCNTMFFGDKKDLEESNKITCPLPRCNHTWCKLCSLPMGQSGPDHSCDGLSELDYLIKQKGWRKCPSTSCFRCVRISFAEIPRRLQDTYWKDSRLQSCFGEPVLSYSDCTSHHVMSIVPNVRMQHAFLLQLWKPYH